jgi:large subunit ribosomal protein L9
MELILLKDVDNVGRKGDVVRVRDGHARNLLIPHRLALPSTWANQQFVSEQKVRAEKRHFKERTEAENKARELEKDALTLQATAGEQDKLFGSITSEDIREALAAKGYALDKKRIHLKEPIRTLGSHTVQVELYPQIKTTVAVEVIRKA